jgi:hypothetical protein
MSSCQSAEWLAFCCVVPSAATEDHVSSNDLVDSIRSALWQANPRPSSLRSAHFVTEGRRPREVE